MRRFVITSGYGKSKYPAMYLADSLGTLGVPALFLDPLEAHHGGLGLVYALASKSAKVDFYMFSRTVSDDAIALANLVAKTCDGTDLWIICDKQFVERTSDFHNVISYKACADDDNCPPTTSIISAIDIAVSIVDVFKTDAGIKFARRHHPAKTQVG